MSTTRQNLDEQGAESIIVSFFRQHPALLVSLLYLQITLIEFIYSWKLYNGFEINIFDFSEISDFLLAAFKEPFSVIMPLIMMVLADLSFVYFPNKFGGTRFHRTLLFNLTTKINKKFMGAVFIFLVLVYTAIPPYLFSKINASTILDGLSRNVHLRYLDGASLSEANEREIAFIGTTEKFAFFYDAATHDRLIVPINRIISIQLSGKVENN